MKALLQLSNAELERLAAEFADGRDVSDGFALRQLLKNGVPAGVQDALKALALHGAASAAQALRLVRETRIASAPRSPELVWSGDDPTGKLRDTAAVVDDLFARAEQQVLLSGFAVWNGAKVFQRLAARMDENPQLDVRCFLNVEFEERRTPAEMVASFSKDFFGAKNWPGKRRPVVYYDPRALEAKRDQRAVLHAKCVVIDGQWALVTSANYTPNAQLKNIELGVLLDDSRLALSIVGQFNALVSSGALVRLP